jgi:hypothetical protein
MVEPLPKPGFDISVFCNVSMSNRDFFMTALYLEAPLAIAASLSVLMAPNARQWRYSDRRLRTGPFFPQPSPA